jgi:hypothetical protein
MRAEDDQAHSEQAGDGEEQQDQIPHGSRWILPTRYV